MELWRLVPPGSREGIRGGRCPKCRSRHVGRTRARSRVERLARAVGPLRPFVCRDCQWRGWRLPVPSEGRVIDLPPLPPQPSRRRKPRPPRERATSGAVRGADRTRQRRQMLLALALAMAAAGALVYLHAQANSAPLELVR